MSTVHCYAQRILNPYCGVRHCIELEHAYAVTFNGQEWALYLSDSANLKYVDHNSLTPAFTANIKYGSWSREQGFRRAALLSTVDNDLIEVLGQSLLQTVQEYSDRLPFPLHDHYELWMLDTQVHPMALLDSRRRQPTGSESVMKRWTAGHDCLERFGGNTLCANLERAVKTFAHKEIPYTWFKRQGNRLIALEEGGAVSSAEAPLLILREHWPHEEITNQAREYIHWQAPYLLMLEGLSSDQRHHLEQAAAEQANLTASLCRLYPVVENKSLMNRIQVQARLQQSGQ